MLENGKLKPHEVTLQGEEGEFSKIGLCARHLHSLVKNPNFQINFVEIILLPTTPNLRNI